MTLPNFLIIGAAKSGTTSLYRYLEQHPQVYMKVKEPGFFAYEGRQVRLCGPEDQERFDARVVVERCAYERLFADVTTEKAYGEASVAYLYIRGTAERIRRYAPDMRLIAILRNPVDRAFSSYLHMRRDGREPLPAFEEALEAEDARVQANWDYIWHYTRLGFYYEQLQIYYSLFPREQIAVFLFDEFQQDPARVTQAVFRFLQIDDTFRPNTSLKYNVSGVPRMRRLHQFVSRPNPVKSGLRPFVPLAVRKYVGTMLMTWNVTGRKPQMKRQTRRQLQTLFREDIFRLQELIGKDLSGWLADGERLVKP